MKHKGLLVVVITGAVCLSRMSHGEASFSAQQKIGQNLAEVQNNLGNAYYTGKGVPQDFKEAAKWYRLAAEQGNAAAQFILGSLYYSGDGVPQDYAQAYAWLSISASQGRQESVESLPNIIKTMTPAQIAEGQRLSREYGEKFGKK